MSFYKIGPKMSECDVGEGENSRIIVLSEEDFVKALNELKVVCYQAKKPDACYLLGGMMEMDGKDLGEVEKVHQGNCDENKYGPSCFKLGEYKLKGGEGHDKKKSLEEAVAYFDKGCDYKDPNACYRSGTIRTDLWAEGSKRAHQDEEKILDRLGSGCDLKHAESCTALSKAFIKGRNIMLSGSS